MFLSSLASAIIRVSVGFYQQRIQHCRADDDVTRRHTRPGHPIRTKRDPGGKWECPPKSCHLPPAALRPAPARACVSFIVCQDANAAVRLCFMPRLCSRFVASVVDVKSVVHKCCVRVSMCDSSVIWSLRDETLQQHSVQSSEWWTESEEQCYCLLILMSAKEWARILDCVIIVSTWDKANKPD